MRPERSGGRRERDFLASRGMTAPRGPHATCRVGWGPAGEESHDAPLWQRRSRRSRPWARSAHWRGRLERSTDGYRTGMMATRRNLTEDRPDPLRLHVPRSGPAPCASAARFQPAKIAPTMRWSATDREASSRLKKSRSTAAWASAASGGATDPHPRTARAAKLFQLRPCRMTWSVLRPAQGPGWTGRRPPCPRPATAS